MSSPDPRLNLLRQDIDAIDTAIHDLIVKRGTIVEDIRKIKKRAGPALRPGREARILRRLAEKHQGAFPLPALVCLWREMMGGFTHMQQPFSGAVHAADGSGYAFWAEQVGALDAINPQVAARLARGLDRWRKYTPMLQAHMQTALRHVGRSSTIVATVSLASILTCSPKCSGVIAVSEAVQSRQVFCMHAMRVD